MEGNATNKEKILWIAAYRNTQHNKLHLILSLLDSIALTQYVITIYSLDMGGGIHPLDPLSQ